MDIPIVVPYTQLRPETRAALAGEDVLYVDVSGRDSDYWELLSGFWHRQQGIILVEHDIVPNPDSIAALRGCTESWCGVPYQVGINIGSWLGLTKFSPELMIRHPDAISRMERTHWQSLDGQLLPYLRQHGEFTCTHWPAARHLNGCGDEATVLTNCVECGSPIRFENVRNGPNSVQCANGHYVFFFTHG